MHTNQSLQARSADQPLAAQPKSALQTRADRSPAVAHLARMQRMADAGATDTAQLYEKTGTKKEAFIPSKTAKIHCHIGTDMREPHLKINGSAYSFGKDWKEARIQEAYDALVTDPENVALGGYEDCREYLCELLGITYKAPEATDAGAGAAAAGGGGNKSTKKGKSGGRKKR